jgi:protein-disulfide isomerase
MAQSAQERREAQREAIRKQRQAELSRQRRVRTTVIAVIIVAALVLAGGIGFGIYTFTQDDDGPVAAPEGLAEDQAYYTLGAPEDSGKPVVELHVDFMCPVCGTFEDVNGADLVEIVENQEATVHLYVRRFLDGNSTTKGYSSRAANAAACVYEDDPDNLITYQQLLFQNQPDEGTAGLNNTKLFEYAQQAGASDSVQSCITGRTHVSWVRDRATELSGQSSTPFVMVGETVMASTEWQVPGTFRSAVEEAGGSSASDGGGDQVSDGGGASDDGEG